MTLAELALSPYVIALLFFLVAFIYSSVGLGGGSAYTALMALLGFSALAIPLISLTLNLFVTAIGSFNFFRNKHARLNLILPFLITSMPMAYLGGSLQLPKQIFYWILFISLAFVAIRIYFWNNISLQLNLSQQQRIAISLISGSILGLIAGIVGIGGGIYLIPLIIILGLGTEKEAAACGAIFVFLNSMFGLISRLQHNPIDLSPYLPLVVAVLVGGFLGSYLGAVKYSARTMDKILGLIILLALFALGRKLILDF